MIFIHSRVLLFSILYAPPIGSFLITTNRSASRRHHIHTHTYTQSLPSLTVVVFTRWPSANNMLLNCTKIAQRRHPFTTYFGPGDSHTHHFRIPLASYISSQKTFFFSRKFSKNFWALSRGPRGSCPPFSNSPSPATYPLIFPDVST